VLARRLGRPFVDLDKRIVADAGLSIPEIFARDGEDTFRSLETAALAAVFAGDEPVVLATGGGVVVTPENIDRLRSGSTVVWVRGTPETLAGRVGDGKGRPLLTAGEEPIVERLRRLADERSAAYRAARELILAGNYKGGIAAMHALGRDEHPDVANYIGYANRKMGQYDQSKVWYEAALKSDPNHTRTWSYYGMWHMEQGNRLKAEDYLAKVNLLCGNTNCQEFTELKAVIDGTASY